MSNPLEMQERARAEGMLMGYLEVVCAPMSLTEFESARRELRGHLFDLSAAYEELGLEPVEAMRAAIAKLGPPKPLGEAIQSQSGMHGTITLRLTPVLVGAAVSAVVMSFADLMLMSGGAVSHSGGPMTALIGFAMGLVAAAVLVRIRCSLLAKAIVCGLIYGPGLLAVVTSMNGRAPTYGFAVAVSVFFGLVGVATAVATEMATRMLARPPRKPVSV